MFIGYWHKGGLDVFRVVKGKVERFASGSPEQLKPVKSLGKIVLIVGREFLLHTRKKFPPASADDLKKAVGLEIGEMFPVKSPSFFLSVFEKTESYTMADIWAWDNSGYDGLKRVFPFTHVLPEDMAFISEDPEISVIGGAPGGAGISHLLAHSNKGFLGASSFRGRAGRSQVDMLLKAIGRHAEDFKRLNLFGGVEVAPDLHEIGLPLTKKDAGGYPACLQNPDRLDLKQFSVRAEPAIMDYIDPAMRFVIYLLVAYGLCLLLTGMHYDAASKEVKMRTAELAARMSAVNPLAAGSAKGVDYAAAAGEIKERMKTWRSPLSIMDELAANLPDKSYITRIVLNETLVDLTVSSNAPLEVVKALGKADGVKTVKLKGSLSKGGGLYTFYLAVELK